MKMKNPIFREESSTTDAGDKIANIWFKDSTLELIVQREGEADVPIGSNNGSNGSSGTSDALGPVSTATGLITEALPNLLAKVQTVLGDLDAGAIGTICIDVVANINNATGGGSDLYGAAIQFSTAGGKHSGSIVTPFIKDGGAYAIGLTLVVPFDNATPFTSALLVCYTSAGVGGTCAITVTSATYTIVR